MPFDPEEVRRLQVRRKAREFARMVRTSNMAHKVPDEIIDWLKDDEVAPFKEHLRAFRLVQRKDFYWEENR